MARAALLVLLIAGWSATTAMSAPAPRRRVVLADPDPELRHAMEQALAPWRLEVVIDGAPPADAAMAQQRADGDTARFVVWRDGDALVVYDRELGSIEKRTSRSGVLDPATAAAAALTIKTMMRLPSPPPGPDPSGSPAGAAESGPEIRIQAGIATRIAHGSDTDVSARFGGAAMIRPWSSAGWRFGLAGDGGTSTSVSRASYKGTWSEWAVLGVASWTDVRAAWELEPHIGAGVLRSTINVIGNGTEANKLVNETKTLPTVRGGLWVRWRMARWTFGAALDIDGCFGTPTYTKADNERAEIFQVPAVAVELGAIVAVDL